MTDRPNAPEEKQYGFCSRFVQWLIRSYQAGISPMLGAHCRFTPSCSQYALEAVREHGVFMGSLYALWRILRCNPFSKGGYDPVPPKKHKKD